MLSSYKQISSHSYQCAKHFQREQNRIFKQLPLIVGRCEQVANTGDFLVRELFGVSIIILRNKNKELNAFPNACPHRGARLLSQPNGSKLNQLLCPYHAWCFSLGGKHEQIKCQRKQERYNLPMLTIYEEFGFIWLTMKKQPLRFMNFAKVVKELPKFLSEDWSKFHLPNYSLYDVSERSEQVNWKLLVEASLETWHFATTHKNTIASYFGDAPISVDLTCKQRVLRSIIPKKHSTSRHASVATATSTKSINKKKHNNIKNDLRQWATIIYFIFPNAFILVERGVYSVLLLFPEGVSQTRLYILHLVPRSHKSYIAKVHIENQINLLSKVFSEDMDLINTIQKNINTGAIHKFQISRHLEPALLHFHKLLKRYSRLIF